MASAAGLTQSQRRAVLLLLLLKGRLACSRPRTCYWHSSRPTRNPTLMLAIPVSSSPMGSVDDPGVARSVSKCI
ncbi:hypothetical protein BKA67DRAFT_544947 [Truncatella angustata]|uniref:Secreted protein n=1 Tax=Truncatella angustata TaxID=152316 RepID=A0A9P9A460_9PEZI|nr:uncharacterized protein BKA67DRAFT_544947 [Truncatella angustata]KAH6659584.1 hypothetical protein BKA67DRAFT_544947 [Truncatella angustata]